MAELTISSDEIRGALERYVSSVTRRDLPRGGRRRRRRRRRHRPRRGPALDDGQRAARVRGRHARRRAEPRRPRDRRRRPGRLRRASRRASRSSGPAGCSRCRSATPSSAAWSTRWASRSTASARSPTRASASWSCRRRTSWRASRVKEPLQTGIKAIDAMTADRPGPAPADHRRPQDRQDHGRARHDHQPAGQLGVRRPEEAGPLHLRRDRPEGLHRSPSIRGTLEEAGAMEYTTIVAVARRPTRPASSTSRRTPARPSASTGCTPASTS